LLLAETLGEQYPNASLLIVTGLPMIHAFRIRSDDYIKLPCLTRHATDQFAPACSSPLDDRDAVTRQVATGPGFSRRT
jgi:predicted glycosyltransferase